MKAENKGHTWKLNEDGEVDEFAMSYEFHNGPMCTKCYYTYCVHCDKGDEPRKECTGDKE